MTIAPRSRTTPLLALLIGLTFACTAAAVASRPLHSGVDRSTFNLSVKPGDDFFQFVNGNWIERNPIPAEHGRWNAFNQLRDSTAVALKDILDELADRDELDEDARKLRDFYQTAMDKAKLQSQGAAPLDDEFQRIGAISNRDELIDALGHLRGVGIPALFHFGVSPDAKNSTQYAAHLWQGGLGLPERDYYLGDSDDSKRIRDAYRAHLQQMFSLIGESDEAAAKSAETVIEMETKLAEASRTPTQLRDREAQYNKQSRTELAELTPHLDWNRYFKAIELEGIDEVIVGQPEFLSRVDALLADTCIADWQTYLRWNLLRAVSPYLSKPFEQEHFNFYSGTLRGAKAMQPRWKRVIGAIDEHVGEALGKLYVEKHFKPAAKKRMDELVKNLMVVFRERLESREWMGDDTKRQALEKLAKIEPKIGYPEKWQDYTDLEVKNDSYVQNVLRAKAFETRDRFSKLGQEVDRKQWHTTPQTVNAYYSSTRNEITFPAGILQPPFFDLSADDAVNYGAIGAVIGHEITHGFDDQGSRSDADGNLRNWWTDGDRGRFMMLAEKLVKQYDQCRAVDDMHVNGRLTLGENIADLGGVTIAYEAYLKSLDGKEAPVLDGFTGPQRFFIGFAQLWRESSRDAELRLMIRTNPHSPGKFRTLVPLSNFTPFYEAFDIGEGDTWYRKPEDRVQIW